MKKRIALSGTDALKDMQYKIWDGINTEANPRFAVAIIAVLEELPANLKANLPKNIKKKLTEMGLNNKLKVQGNLRIETEDVLKKEDLEMSESDYERMRHIRSFKSLDIGMGSRCCIEKALVSKESKPVKILLRR